MSKIKRIRIVLQDKLLNLAKQCGSVLFYDTTDADSGSLSSHCVSKVYISKQNHSKADRFSARLEEKNQPSTNQANTK